MFSLDNVKLDITKEAIERVADLALELKTGARGLRTILEDALLDVMYATPADKTIDKIIIDADVINKVAKPKVIHAEKPATAPTDEKKTTAKKSTDSKSKTADKELTATSA